MQTPRIQGNMPFGCCTNRSLEAGSWKMAPACAKSWPYAFLRHVCRQAYVQACSRAFRVSVTSVVQGLQGQEGQDRGSSFPACKPAEWGPSIANVRHKTCKARYSFTHTKCIGWRLFLLNNVLALCFQGLSGKIGLPCKVKQACPQSCLLLSKWKKLHIPTTDEFQAMACSFFYSMPVACRCEQQ